MKNRLYLFCLLAILLLFCSSWGFFAHKSINHSAVFILPKGMIGFYKNNINYLTDHAVDPDKRRYVDPIEAPRHFLDADYYGSFPFDSIPQQWNEAVDKYSADTLNKYGTVPWTIQRNYYHLVQAFKDLDSIKILKYSADLGHYVADAHVPLHMTSNYNGQKTNQIGIHAFWESRLPELFADRYNFFTGKAVYIDDPLKNAWKICRTTYKELDSVLVMERKLQAFPVSQKYTFIKNSNKLIRNYAEPYASKYHDLLNGMVEKQMRASVLAIGSYWFSAWVDAGQPNLKGMVKRELSAEEKMKEALEEYRFQNGKILGREDL
ncbi:zinc dependent phospholipase C family protein [Mucilaginibacter arboris]|uniref:S1/P1 Nuclease n=1 Tax=Mucilaginibacter arboris TaxID=2682090 RepID=A0A7K1SUP1_9SPHI|nr:zinc dependent phospholipase C family protein [Mucilaginibacter arboris]MVN21046.1 S1/P1 Nuclease [Mucilaginibacter arboris]